MTVIALEWKGETYTLNESEAFEAADAVEDIATYGELVMMLGDLRTIRYARLAKCYGILLREAGANVSDLEIHNEFKAAIRESKGVDIFKVSIEAINMLTKILVGDMPQSMKGDGDTKNEEAPAS